MEEVDDTCNGCAHAHIIIINQGEQDERPRIECRRYPPQMFVLRNDDGVDEVWSGFPNALERCGEYFNESRVDAPRRIAQRKVDPVSNTEQPTHITQYGTIGAYPDDTVVIESTAPLSQHDIDRAVTAFYETGRSNFTSLNNFLNDQPVRARIRKIGNPWESEL